MHAVAKGTEAWLQEPSAPALKRVLEFSGARLDRRDGQPSSLEYSLTCDLVSAERDEGRRVAPGHTREPPLGLEPSLMSLLGWKPVVDRMDRLGHLDPSIPLGSYPGQDSLVCLPPEHHADPLLFKDHGGSPQRTIRGVSGLVQMSWHEDAEGDGHASTLTCQARAQWS